MMFSFRSARPGRGRGTSSRSTPPPKVLSKKEIQQKQENLIHSLREAETKQLTDYLKNRSSILDQEIQQTREKLNLNLSSSSPNPRLSIHPREREREPRSPGIWKDPAKGKKNEDNDIEHYEKEEYQLKYLLKRLLQCMEDSRMTPAQITSCFLPSQHLKYKKGIISLQDAVEVFQVDLVQPLSKHDQSLLLKGYGTEHHEVDIQTLLQDLGFWDPSLPESPPQPYLRGRDDDLDEELPPQFRESLHRTRSPPLDNLSLNDRSKNDLADIHDLVKGTLAAENQKTKSNRVYDEVDLEEELENDEDILSALRAEMEKEKTQTLTNKPDSGSEEKKDDKLENSKQPSEPPNKTIEQQAAENVAKALALENAKLKKELSAFDREFFEELEDMKLQLSELQMSQNNAPSAPKSPSRHKAPLSPRTIGRLGKSARVSLNTMSRWNRSDALTGQYDMSQSLPDRLTSPTRRPPRPKFAWSLQTAPIPSQLENLASAQREFEPVDLRASLRGSLSESLGRGATAESFGSLCERRLQFELQNHIDPGRATKTLLHEINSLAHSEKCKGYILPKDLHSIMTHIGIAMSLKEVEVLCTGFASNGAGGVDALELGRVIQTMMYNALNHPENELDSKNILDNALQGSLEALARDVILNKAQGGNLLPLREYARKNTLSDQEAILSNIYSKVEKVILSPFFRFDADEKGVLHLKDFAKLLHTFSTNISQEEINFFGEYYSASKNESSTIFYPYFVQDLSRAVTELLLSNDPLTRPLNFSSRSPLELNSSTPWLIREFDFIDELLNQLEGMKPSVRRKVLMQLQSTLSSQENQSGEDGYLDGYTVLKSLLAVGFNIPRDMRVKFLNNIEKYSGFFNYVDLCAILSSSCLNWTTQERMVLGKILLTMGVTSCQRWQWLHRLKRDLQLSLRDTQKRKKNSKNTSSVFRPDEDPPVADSISVSASVFLHCLRENGVNLDIDEEAVLLDCLDFERQTNTIYSPSRLSLEDKEAYSTTPEVSYESFLTVCSHFVGKWYHTAPEINDKLKSLMLPMSESSISACIKELETLFRAFDESASNTIEFRPFLVSCRRSRLLSALESDVTEELGKLLIEEGDGKIKYTPFLLHLRALQHSLKQIKIVNKTIIEGKKVDEYELVQQLLRTSSEHVTGTLKPLRDFLSQLQQSKSSSASSYFPLSSRDVTELLREFSVVYNPQELDEFLELISSSISVSDYFQETPVHTVHWNPLSFTLQLPHPNASSLVHVLQQIRLPWYKRHPRLVMKIRKLLSRISTDGLSKLITRLQAFSRATDISTLHTMELSDDNPTAFDAGESETYVSGEIFQVVLGRCGLILDDQEIYFLCDEADSNPQPSKIRISILLEALSQNEDKDGTKRRLSDIHSAMESSPPPAQWKNTTSRKYDDPSSGLFALEHLKGLLWTTGTKLKRRNEEWKNDVLSLMDGFDRGGGVMSTEDFVLALSILSIRLSEDILLAIPRISPSIDMIPYKQILDIIFDTSLEYDIQQQQSRFGIQSRDRYRDIDSSPSPEGRVATKSQPKNSPVQTLINLVRKTLNMFLSQQKDIEHAWSTLLAVFTKFDPDHENVVSPRDFCLAVSVLMDGDSPVFTKHEWQEVIDHFRCEKSPSSGVDYIKFLDVVLDSTATKEKKSRQVPSWMNDSQRNIHPRDTLSSSLRKDRYRSSLSPTRTTSRSLTPTHDPMTVTNGIQSRLRASRNSLNDPLETYSRSMSKDGTKKNVTYAPFEPPMIKSNYYAETDEDYRNSSTISGRGVVGTSFTNKSRIDQLTKTSIPRTMSKYDEMFGPLPSTLSKSLTASISPGTSSHSLVSSSETLPSSQLKFLSNFDTFTIKEFNSELYDCLTLKLGLTDVDGNEAIGSNGLTRKNLLLKYLDMEDKNHSGTLTKHSFLAGLNALGVTHAFWSKPLQKELINKLNELGNGMIVIQDVMKLILFK